MEIYVACDICGHRYVLSGDRSGRNAKCKSCGVSFEVNSDNYYDPDTSELDEPAKNDDDDGSSMSPLWNIAHKIGHGLAGLVTLGILVWMGSLVFRSPREAAANIVSNAATRRTQNTINQNRNSQFIPVQPQVRPQPRKPFVQPQLPFTPPSNSPPIRGVPSPPVIDGSMGWPKSEPETQPPATEPIVKPAPQPNRRSRTSDLTVGQTVEVLRDGEWLAAIVRRIEANGTIRIHYRGLSQGDDESVPRDRIRTK